MSVNPIKLPRLPANQKLINADGSATLTFSRWWQSIVEQVETAINGIIALPEIQAAIAEAQAAADAANAAAAAASTAATNAQSSASANTSEQSLVNSGMEGFTPPAIKVNSAGAVTVANHNRRYGNSTLNPTVAVAGATFSTGGTSGDIIYVFYDDPTRAGGAVTYQYSMDPADTVQGGVRHSIGSVIVPSTGSADGTPVLPVGVT
jgi:Flp pilus assembly protein TadG